MIFGRRYLCPDTYRVSTFPNLLHSNIQEWLLFTVAGIETLMKLMHFYARKPVLYKISFRNCYAFGNEK